jgi:hypothetical protein
MGIGIQAGGKEMNDINSFDFSSKDWSMYRGKDGKLHFVDHDKGLWNKLWNKLKKLRSRYLPTKWLVVPTNEPSYYQWRWMGRDLFKTKWRDK